jgi:hypothetical protein
MKFSQLPPRLAEEMDRQRAFVSTLVAKNFPGKRLTKNSNDFEILQRIVDKKLVQKNQSWELQALGICFGDALINYIPGLKWSLVSDAYGTDPTLQYKETTTQFNAPSMISKRVEDGQAVEVTYLADYLKDFIKKESADFGPSK